MDGWEIGDWGGRLSRKEKRGDGGDTGGRTSKTKGHLRCCMEILCVVDASIKIHIYKYVHIYVYMCVCVCVCVWIPWEPPNSPGYCQAIGCSL